MAGNSTGEMAAFVQVVEEGSFTAAARSLHVSPSAVSKLVARLEDRLTVRLLQRTTRRLALTAEGRLFYDRCRELLDEIAAAEEQVAGSRLRPRGTLRMGVSHGFGMRCIVPLVPLFAERYPEIELQLAFADRRVDLVAEGLDLALRLGPVQDESLVARRLSEHGRIVCAAPAYLARHGVPRAPEDLLAHNCILFDQPEHLNQWPFRHPDGSIERLRVRGMARSDSGDALYQLLLNGFGIAWAADFLALEDIAAGRLVPLLEPFRVDLRTPLHAVYPQRRHLPAKVRVLIDFLVERLAAGLPGTVPA